MNRTRAAFAAFIVIVAAAIAPAWAQTGAATANPVSPPTVGSGSTATQNPYVNPSAAGTQLGQPNERAPAQAAAPAPAYSLHPADKTPFSAVQARQAMEAQGYTSVAGLRRSRGAIWQATAMHDGRQVHIGLDPFGTVAELR